MTNLENKQLKMTLADKLTLSLNQRLNHSTALLLRAMREMNNDYSKQRLLQTNAALREVLLTFVRLRDLLGDVFDELTALKSYNELILDVDKHLLDYSLVGSQTPALYVETFFFIQRIEAVALLDGRDIMHDAA